MAPNRLELVEQARNTLKEQQQVGNSIQQLKYRLAAQEKKYAELERASNHLLTLAASAGSDSSETEQSILPHSVVRADEQEQRANDAGRSESGHARSALELTETRGGRQSLPARLERPIMVDDEDGDHEIVVKSRKRRKTAMHSYVSGSYGESPSPDPAVDDSFSANDMEYQPGPILEDEEQASALRDLGPTKRKDGQRVHPVNHPNVVWVGTKAYAIACGICGCNAFTKFTRVPEFFKGAYGLAMHYRSKHEDSVGCPRKCSQVLSYCDKQLIPTDIAERISNGEAIEDLVAMRMVPYVRSKRPAPDRSSKETPAMQDHKAPTPVEYRARRESSRPDDNDGTRKSPSAMPQTSTNKSSAAFGTNDPSEDIAGSIPRGLGPRGLGRGNNSGLDFFTKTARNAGLSASLG